MRKHVWFFDLLRCIAAFAVVAIHVLGPYRELLGTIPFSDWVTAVLVNGASRWAVPVFIMITGALMLSDTRPFELHYYVKRRLGKVMLPFVVWSLFYAWLSGCSPTGFDGKAALDVLAGMPSHETYYHLGFFYYFLPLYLVIPLLRPVMQKADRVSGYALVAVWLWLTGMYLMGWQGMWRDNLVMYSGYLVLGYVLWRWPPPAWLVVPVGGLSLLATEWAAITTSLSLGEYSSAGWFSYKTLNTALIAAMVFYLAMRWGEGLPEQVRKGASRVSRYSLGIYLLHPLFLWPVRAYDLYYGPAWLMILGWTLIAGGMAMGASALLARYRYTAWLVP
ncbi:acyltransferase family protein [Parasalinivibrio latis]|uniref:acyltransferase n=1 Tax=Parasalinivibrio latis TaxID=2952610 RepID=UPI0030DE5DE3